MKLKSDIGAKRAAAFIIAVCVLCPNGSMSQAAERVIVQQLRCEYLDNPLGIDVVRPRLSWLMESSRRGQRQTTYQILVAGSEKNLRAHRGDLWDSGRVASDETAQIAYAGRPSDALGSVGEWMVDTAAGIDSDAQRPGFKHIVIQPRPDGGLTFARATYDSIRGRIASDWKINDGTFTLNVTIPANTTATVYIPAADKSKVLEGGRLADKTDGIKFLRMEDGSAVFAVESGTYRFAVR